MRAGRLPGSCPACVPQRPLVTTPPRPPRPAEHRASLVRGTLNDRGEAPVRGSLRHPPHTAQKPSWQGQQLQKELVRL